MEERAPYRLASAESLDPSIHLPTNHRPNPQGGLPPPTPVRHVARPSVRVFADGFQMILAKIFDWKVVQNRSAKWLVV